eukprot:TRINITY_DN14761_c0_g1_i4.p1 TRINITY_DN14761_c0_g1~~TRINITY_DN14761_c0_g1_i4.p1  ORF type:complete len:396 (+),score=89.59 TRINITY_DN14761_c0_g1_i4:90-1190(+)
MPSPTPLEQPPFTIRDIKAAIPPHCFERSYVTSFLYLGRDVALIGALLGFGVFVRSLGGLAAGVLWPVYWVAQGICMTGLWVTAHECGHQAFSPSKAVNDAVGLLAHSVLLVPYHPWRISHGHHHQNTGSMENDEVFVPKVKDYSRAPYEVAPAHDKHASSAQIAVRLAGKLLLGWPIYLLLNVTGPAKYKGKKNDHFRPSSVLFPERSAREVVVSDVALAAWVGVLVYLCRVWSVGTVAALYFVPYLFVNFWLVLITVLQHSDVYLPHYRSDEWNWLRGALCTVDRSYGAVLDNLLHHIADTHVCHHLFSYIPHYHAVEATAAMRKVLGPYYLRDETPIAEALWRTGRECRFVDAVDEVVFFRPY